MAFITLSVSTADAMPKNQTEGVLTAFKILNTFEFCLNSSLKIIILRLCLLYL